MAVVGPGLVLDLVAAGPWGDRLAGGGRQRVVLDAEVAGFLVVGPDEEAREVEAVFCQRVEVAAIVEVCVDDGAVVLAGADQDRRPASEDEITAVPRMPR